MDIYSYRMNNIRAYAMVFPHGDKWVYGWGITGETFGVGINLKAWAESVPTQLPQYREGQMKQLNRYLYDTAERCAVAAMEELKDCARENLVSRKRLTEREAVMLNDILLSSFTFTVGNKFLLWAYPVMSM